MFIQSCNIELRFLTLWVLGTSQMSGIPYGYSLSLVNMRSTSEKADSRQFFSVISGSYLAALDWGASFGYPRLASVIASSPVRLLVFPGASFNTLVRDVPGFGDAIRRVVRECLPGL